MSRVYFVRILKDKLLLIIPKFEIRRLKYNIMGYLNSTNPLTTQANP